MAVSKSLLRKMAAEVSVETLGGLLADYSGRIADREAVTADTLEDVAAIELIVAEIKSRGGIRPERQKRSKPEVVNVIGNNGGAAPDVGSIRTQSGQL